ncbi:MAG TPA: hypothetical protein VHM88_20570 [Candidatus Acidoferrales bacterium]|nr:hypothetical protein [Candidatus Acidoferrales bacterium]
MKVRDIAEAARTYAKAAHLSREAQNHAAEIALLAARKAGEILSKLEKSKGGAGTHEDKKVTAASIAGVSEYTQALKDTDTPERTAQYWQRLADVPQTVVDQYFTDCKEGVSEGPEITAAGLLRRNEVYSAPDRAKTNGEIINALSVRLEAIKVAIEKRIVGDWDGWDRVCHREMETLRATAKEVGEYLVDLSNIGRIA